MNEEDLKNEIAARDAELNTLRQKISELANENSNLKDKCQQLAEAPKMLADKLVLVKKRECDNVAGLTAAIAEVTHIFSQYKITN